MHDKIAVLHCNNFFRQNKQICLTHALQPSELLTETPGETNDLVCQFSSSAL